MPSGVGNPFAYAEHGRQNGIITQAEITAANTNPNSAGGNVASLSQINETAPGSVPLPKPIVNLVRGTPCDLTGQMGNPDGWGDPAKWYAANGFTVLSYPAVLYGCSCTGGTNAAGGCQAYGDKFLKVIDTLALGIGLALVLAGAFSGSIILVLAGGALAIFGILNATFGWVNP